MDENALKWCKRFEKVMDSLPDGYELFIAAGCPALITLDENGNTPTNKSGGVSQDAIAYHFSCDWRIDGGDW